MLFEKLETGKRNVSEYELHGYCEVFNTTSDYLLGFTNVSSTDREALAISSVTGLSDKSLNELKQYSAFQRTFTDKLISSKALLKIMEAYIYRNSYLFHKIEITDEFIKKVTLSNDENKNYHYYRSEQLLRDALNVLDNDIELFNTLNHSHTKNMWKTVIDFCIETQDIDNLLAYFKKNKAAIPATVIEYAQLKAKEAIRMKLPNGYGSVYKLSGKRRCPYRAIITERWQRNAETGKFIQKRKTIGYYETKALALEALADYRKSPFDLETSKITLQRGL